MEPAPDDEEVFGEAWELVKEWRALKGSHPNEGRGLAWLKDEERLLEMELALLEDHGMTLPPEQRPLRGFARSGQTSWRRTALDDTRKALARREFWLRIKRWLTPGAVAEVVGASIAAGRRRAVSTSVQLLFKFSSTGFNDFGDNPCRGYPGGVEVADNDCVVWLFRGFPP